MTEDLTGRLAFAIAAGAIGSAFQHGYATGVVNAPQSVIMAWIMDCVNKTEPEVDVGDRAAADGDHLVCTMDREKATYIWSLVVAIFCVGGMIGGSCVKLISSKLGRKGGLLINNVLMAIAGVLMLASKYAHSYEILIAGRLVIGINSGINAGVAPMYLSEISPVSLRGAVGTVYQLIITISILLAQVLGMQGILGNAEGWPILFFLTVIPGVFQLVTLPFCPESPKFLLLDKDDEERAVSALTWLRGRVDVHSEVEEMKAEQETAKSLPSVSIVTIVKTSSYRSPLIIAMMMMLAQQLSGINAAIFFSTSIFRSAGLSDTESQYATLAMGGMNVAMTFVSLVLIEKAGRKTLMLVGLSIMLGSTIMLLVCLAVATSVFAYISIVMVVLFVIGFATGPGSIPWFFVTELFRQAARPMATSIAVVTNWSANFLVGLLFEPLKLYMGPYVFIIFIVMQLLFIIYVAFKVPETKNKTIEEITAQFK